MTTPLKQLIAQKQALERQITEARSSARASAIAEVRQLMGEHDLTAADLAGKAPTSKVTSKLSKTVAPKYRDPATGATWSGRGLKPKWLAAALASGKELGDFGV